MAKNGSGSFKLFQFAGITVSLHWSWLVIAIIEIQNRRGGYSSLTWNILEYLSLFLIVLLHEFGHALACKQVGGKADNIMLWPLGGIAYVSPPQRPGAVLWSIAAGPLVNVLLGIILTPLLFLSQNWGLPSNSPDLYGLLRSVWYINTGLFIFNIIPVYPLDGGQILRALLWFFLGSAKSLLVSSIVGILGALGFVGLSLAYGEPWLFIITVFLLSHSIQGFKLARVLTKALKAPRHHNYACPSCGEAPPVGARWQCHKCGKILDTFLSDGACPDCGTVFNSTQCAFCGESGVFGKWRTGPPASAVIEV